MLKKRRRFLILLPFSSSLFHLAAAVSSQRRSHWLASLLLWSPDRLKERERQRKKLSAETRLKETWLTVIRRRETRVKGTWQDGSTRPRWSSPACQPNRLIYRRQPPVLPGCAMWTSSCVLAWKNKVALYCRWLSKLSVLKKALFLFSNMFNPFFKNNENTWNGDASSRTPRRKIAFFCRVMLTPCKSSMKSNLGGLGALLDLAFYSHPSTL